MSVIISDPYQLALMTMGYSSTYVTGQRVVFDDGMPIRQNLEQQYDPMEWKRWSFDTNCEAIRMYIQNDCAIGQNVYVTSGTIVFTGTTPLIMMYVDPTTCNLTVSYGGVVSTTPAGIRYISSWGTSVREWGIHSSPWAQLRSVVHDRRGIALGENGTWLLGFVPDRSFGMLARRHPFEDWHKGDGYADVWCELTSVDDTGELQDADYVGRGALFFGADNNYRIGVDRTGRACIWQKDTLSKLYTLVEKF